MLKSLKFRIILSASLTVCAVPSNVFAQATTCGATTNSAIADKIANGHAWTDHKQEFVAGAIFGGLAMPASPKVTTVAEFKSHVLTVMGSSTNKTLLRGRKAWWLASTGTITIFDPNSVDCGTTFRPTPGKAYYDNNVN
jgi:hypothetical protein